MLVEVCHCYLASYVVKTEKMAMHVKCNKGLAGPEMFFRGPTPMPKLVSV